MNKQQSHQKVTVQNTAGSNDCKHTITVFYDGICPQCVQDRHLYLHIAGQAGAEIKWFDINGQDDYLLSLGINPKIALSELHIQLSDGTVLSEFSAYIVLMKRVWVLKPLALLISVPLVRPFLAKIYHYKVQKRLKATKRL